MKTCEESVKRNAELNSKATIIKTVIKSKFVDRFSLKNFGGAIDQCCVKSPNFVFIELFELSNEGPKLSKY